MQEIYPNLFRTEPYRLFPLGSFKVTAYFLVRPEGNLLIYSSKNIEEHFGFMEKRGGLKATMITHVHEASAFCNVVANHFKVPFYSPGLESGQISEKCTVDKTYEGSFMFDDSLEIIFTPGHTIGSSCFIWTTPEDKRILFTGDNIYPTHKDRWDAFALQKEDIPAIISSLRRIQLLEVDVVVPASHSVKDMLYKEVDKAQWFSICEGAISRIQAKL